MNHLNPVSRHNKALQTHTSHSRGNVTGAGKGLSVTFPLLYLSHNPLLWSVDVSSGTPATTEQVIPPPTPRRPSCPQLKTSQRPNCTDPDLNPTLRPRLSPEDELCLLPNMHRWLRVKEGTLLRVKKGNKCKELERRPGNRIRPYLQLTAFSFCGEASLNLLLNNWLPPTCSNTPETLLWFVHKMSPLQISLSEKAPHLPATACNTRGLFFYLFIFFLPPQSLSYLVC